MSEVSYREYNRRCDQVDAFRRDGIEKTADTIRPQSPALALLLRTQLKAPPIPKPASLTGGKETDYLELSLTCSEAHAVVLALYKEGLRCRVEGERVPDEESIIHDLCGGWENYWYAFDGE
jgi:hypothetical protein